MRNVADRLGNPRMSFAFRPMTLDDARAIARWRYEAPYDFYNSDESASIAAVPDGYVTVIGGGDLAGFFCFGFGARVPGGERSGCYLDDALDVGLGLRPDLTVRSLGEAFVLACLDYAMERFMPKTVRLTVATFNERVIRVYERVGFRRGACCHSPVRGVETEFMVMHRPMAPVERESDALSR